MNNSHNYLNFSLYGILMTATRGTMPKHTRLLFVHSFRSSSINTCNIGYLYVYIRNTLKHTQTTTNMPYVPFSSTANTTTTQLTQRPTIFYSRTKLSYVFHAICGPDHGLQTDTIPVSTEHT